MNDCIRTFFLILLGLFFQIGVINGQQSSKEIDMEKFIESLFSIQDEDLNYEDLYESLYNLYLQPLNLNKAGPEELKSLYILSQLQIQSFLNHRKEFGELVSIYELQAIPNWDNRTIEQIKPFVTIQEASLAKDPRPLWRRIVEEENNFLLLRYGRTLEEKRGYTAPDTLADGRLTNRYAGSPNHIYGRLRIQHPHDFSIGLTFEKDPGEQMIWDPETKRYGMDFYSFHFHLKEKGNWNHFLLGDFQIQAGQSLVFGAGFSPGKGAEAVAATRRSHLGIQAYTSVLETGFFRGVAASYQVKNLEITAMGSVLPQDAILRSDTLSEQEDFIQSIQQTGFHRTPSEIAAKNSITELAAGTLVKYKPKRKNWEIGASSLILSYSTPIQRRANQYNQFEFNGDFNYLGSLYGNYTWQNFNFFGEHAQSMSGGTGTVAGFIASLSQQVEWSVIYRNYDRDFHSPYARGFGEGVRNINEMGWYSGLKVQISRSWSFSGYYDIFRFPWLRFRADAPSVGYEYLFRATYQPQRDIALYLQWRQEGKERNLNENFQSGIYPLAMGVRNNVWLNLDWNKHPVIGLRSRIQASNFSHGSSYSRGMVILQDLNLDLKSWRLSGRLALFDTDDFENRQYVFERNVQYAFSIPAYFGRGLRRYLLVRYKASRKTTFWLRIARSTWLDRDHVGTGLERIEGPNRTDITFQIRKSF